MSKSVVTYASLARLFTLALAITSCSKKDETVKPEEKTIVEAVYASGFVVSKDEYEIVAQVDGYVSNKLADDGAVVKKGDAIYVIDSDQQSARNRIAQETFELASKNYKQDSPVIRELKTALEAAKTKKTFDSTNFVRYTNLLNRNATTRAEFDRMKLLYENSKNDYDLQKSRYDKTINQLRLDYENAKNNLVIASNESGRYIIRSETDGRIFMTTKEKGELIRRGEVIAIVGKNDAHYLQLSIDELDIQKVKTGQSVLVKIDAYPSKVFEAEITKVYPIVDRRQQSVRADAELKDQLPGSFSGLAVEANIIINRKEKALVIPRSALLHGDSVIVNGDDEVKKIKIKKGVETLDEVEVVDGINPSSEVVVKGS